MFHGFVPLLSPDARLHRTLFTAGITAICDLFQIRHDVSVSPSHCGIRDWDIETKMGHVPIIHNTEESLKEGLIIDLTKRYGAG